MTDAIPASTRLPSREISIEEARQLVVEHDERQARERAGAMDEGPADGELDRLRQCLEGLYEPDMKGSDR